MASTNSKGWSDSMKIKYNILMEYHTWTLVERPPNINMVGSRWTFRVKHDNLGLINKLKSRLVAQGFSQVPGLDFNEMYLPFY